MALILNEEQQMLKESADGFLREVAPVEALRKLRDERNVDGFSRSLWQQMTDMGWPGILIPEEYGGLAFGHVGMGQISEACGRTLTASPLFASAVLGASALALAGSEQQQKELLPKISAGELLLALAVDEGPRYDPLAIAMAAKKNSSGYVLNGAKQFVVDGHSAQTFIVCARTDGAVGTSAGLTLFLVDAAAAGVQVERVIMADSRNSAMLRFNDVVVDRDAILGELHGGYTPLQQVLDIGNAHLAAELLGISLEVFERTVKYLQERKQFGVIIGSFQGLQHRAAHLFSELQQARSVVLRALQGLQENHPDRGRQVSIAKAKVSEVAQLATNEAIQMHGGIGMTDDLDLGFFIKRARVAEQLYGDHRYHLRRFAELSGY